ncbi:MAG TPA: ABC transporter permease [Alphaproteobacteria bacterium]|nr:ABC transporter permease [Alphaproteobacteria bacterium]
MRTIRSWFLRLAGIFNKQQCDQELTAELESHVQLHVDDNLRSGMTAVEARRKALMDLGHMEAAKEAYRDRAGVPALEHLMQDLRFGIRLLRKSPGFTIVAVLTLAVGIGANTAIFSILDPLLLRKLPVRNPEEIVRVEAVGTLYRSPSTWEVSALERFRENNSVLSGVLAFVPVTLEDVVHDGQSVRVRAELVSGEYFNVLGMRPFAGRLLSPDDARGTDGNPVVTLGFDYWRREFGADPKVIGKTMQLHGKAYVVTGIAPPEFFGVVVGESADIYVPLPSGRLLRDSNAPVLGDWVAIMARLKPGVSANQAQAGLEPAFRQIRAESQIPEVEQRQMMERLVIAPAAQGLSFLRDRFSLPARILMGVVGIVLLIACSNVANLLLARAATRRREITIRFALGAKRWRLVRQLLTESALLAGAGTLAGLLLARWASRVLLVSMSDAQHHIFLATDLNVRVLLFAAAVAVMTVLLCGLAPAYSATSVELGQDIKSYNSELSGKSPFRLSNLFVLGQIALSVTLMVAAGLLLHTLLHLETMDVGFSRSRILAIEMNGNAPGRTADQVNQFYEQLLEKTRALPGVRSAALSAFAPISGHMFGVNLSVEGYTPRGGEELHGFFNVVRPGYFATLGIPVLEGRDFFPGDRTTSTRVAIINLTMARHFFGQQSALGRRIQIIEGGGPPLEVVGVVADSKYDDLREETPDFFYMCGLQRFPARPMVRGTLTVLVERDASALKNTVPALVHSLDPTVRITGVKTLREQIDDSLHDDRLIASLCGAFSAMALMLTCIGLYGVLSFSVARRTHEIGIRMALGAGRGDILTLVGKQGMKMVLVGLLLGSVGAWAATGLISGLLFGVRRGDPIAFFGTGLLLVMAALLACYFPARRATRVDPQEALRNE